MDEDSKYYLDTTMPQSQGTTTTALGLRKPSQRWPTILAQMAQDMRQDWAPGQIEYWKQELRDYRDEEITEALKEWTGLWFPSVKAVREWIEIRRANKYAQHQQDRWQAWQDAQRRAQAEGKLATDEDYAKLRAVFRKVAGLK